MDEAKARKERDRKSAIVADLASQREAQLAPFASELPAEKELLIEQTRFYIGQGAVSWIEAGRRLIVLKEQAGHGSWLDVCNELDISPRTASEMMRVAQKFSGLDSMLHLGTGKLIALLDVSEEELNKIEKTGTVLGMSVDAIHAMTTAQLRKKLREERDINKKGQDQIAAKDAENLDLKEQVVALKIGPKTDLEFMEECAAIQQDAKLALARLRALFPRAKTETQRSALVGTYAHLDRECALFSYHVREALDPTNEDSPADGAQFDQMPDGINWLEPSVVEFLKLRSHGGSWHPEEEGDDDE